MGDLSLLFNLSNHIYINMDSPKLNLYFGLYSNTILFALLFELFPFRSLEAIPVGSYVPLTYPCYFITLVLLNFLVPLHAPDCLHIPAPVLELIISPRSLGSFRWR